MPSDTPLFLEATQRKTVRTETAVLWEDPIEAEVQEVSIRSTRNRRRPVVTTGADAPQLARSIRSTDTAVAVARGRTHRVFCWSFHRRFFSLFLEATQRKTVPTVMAVLRKEPAGVEVQEVGIGTFRWNCRRPAVAAVADITQCSIPVVMSGVAVARGRGAPIFFDRAPRGTRRQDFSLNYSRKLRPKTCDSQQTATKGRASRRHPARREVPLGTRKLELASTTTAARMTPKKCSAPCSGPTVIDRAPWEILFEQLT